MEYRKLGKSGLKVSAIGLGSLDFGRRIGEQQSISIINHALSLGINLIDTADVYGDGRSEEIVGKAVKGRRSEVIIATKFGMPTSERPNGYGGSHHHLMEAIDASLKRLGTDYIDLYYIHWPDPTTPIEETLRALDGLVRTGKVRYIACSNFAAWQLCEALWTSRIHNLKSFVAVQTRYNLIDRGIEAELTPCCQSYGIGVIPWQPLAEGFLTGRYQRGKPVPTETRLGFQRPARSFASSPFYTGRQDRPSILTDTNFDKLEKLERFSMEHGHTVAELAIAWLLSHSYISSVIAGATNPEHLSGNVVAAAWRLTAQEMAELD